MATTPSHGVQAGLLAYYVLKFSGVALQSYLPSLWSLIQPFAKFILVVVVAFAFVFGMLPDLIGMYGHAHAALNAHEHGDAQWLSARDWSAPGGYYWRAHNSDLYERFKVIPFYWLHVWEDKFFHKQEGGWSSDAYMFEVIIDVFMLAIIWFEWKSLRRE